MKYLKYDQLKMNIYYQFSEVVDGFDSYLHAYDCPSCLNTAFTLTHPISKDALECIFIQCINCKKSQILNYMPNVLVAKLVIACVI
jgi:hypothetical protein